MLDIQFIREHTEEVKKNIQRLKRPELLEFLNAFLKQDEEWRTLKGKIDELRRKRNEHSQQINQLMKEGKKKEAQKHIKEVKEIPEKIVKKEEKLEEIQGKRDAARRRLPNIIHEDVPYGKSDEDNVEINKWGKIRTFDFPIKNHVELVENLQVGNFEESARTTGNGFYFLKKELALLNQALIRFAIDFMQKKGYTYVEPPLMVKKKVLDAALDTEAFAQSIYSIEGEDLHLIATSEQAILGMLDGQLLKEEDLPLKVYAYSMCFRKEIGSHGINEKGLWRTHQFNKVEQFIFCTEEQSWKMYEELMQNTTELLKALELPHRWIEICTGDLAVWKARSHDFEVYRPTTKEYGELGSLSNCTTYQAEGLNIKYNAKEGKKYVHTLNNTALATSRTMVAILEHYQEKDGSVIVPKVLQPYMYGIKKIKR